MGEDHGMAKLTQDDVVKCREWYAEGKSAREIHEGYFKNIISFSGFQRMWHGQTWKHIKPEVFNNNPRPKQKLSEQQILDIRERYNNGEKISDISKSYKGIVGRTAIHNVAKVITCSDNV